MKDLESIPPQKKIPNRKNSPWLTKRGFCLKKL